MLKSISINLTNSFRKFYGSNFKREKDKRRKKAEEDEKQFVRVENDDSTKWQQKKESECMRGEGKLLFNLNVEMENY